MTDGSHEWAMMQEQHRAAMGQMESQHAGAMRDMIAEHARPSVLFRPTLKKNGYVWEASYGECYAGGATPEEAMRRFDQKWTQS